jgi:multidrug efflux pump subunit AcrA (membrane-fusion protein)
MHAQHRWHDTSVQATVEISSRYDGVIKSMHHAVGSIVKVGQQ